MELKIERSKNSLTIGIIGRLDTVTAPELEKAVDENAQGVTDLVFDLGAMEYTSSAGLRVFLKTQKRMNAQGNMSIINVRPDVMEIFEVTGFTDILNIK